MKRHGCTIFIFFAALSLLNASCASDDQQEIENQISNQQNNEFSNQQFNQNDFGSFDQNNFSNFNNGSFNDQQFFAEGDNFSNNNVSGGDSNLFFDQQNGLSQEELISQNSFNPITNQGIAIDVGNSNSNMNNLNTNPSTEVIADPIQQNVLPLNNLQEIAPSGTSHSKIKSLETQLPRYDLMPRKALVWFVGFDYKTKDGLVNLEIITRGSPFYDVFREYNQTAQPELVVRFYDTKLRPKIKRDIDASEFKSPVAFVRMRENKILENAEVVITMRDPSPPKLFAKDGNLLISFGVPEKYLSEDRSIKIDPTPIETIQAFDVSPVLVAGSDLPLAMKPSPQFFDPNSVTATDTIDGTGDVVVEFGPSPETQNFDPNGLPNDFDLTPQNTMENVKFSNNFGSFDNQWNSDNQNYNNNQYQENDNQYQENDYQNQYQNNQNFDQNQELDIDNDMWDDFDNGEGEASFDDEKFEVRKWLEGDFIVGRFSISSVGQDNNFENQFSENESNNFDQSFNQDNESNFNQEMENQGLNNTGNNDFSTNNFGNITGSGMGENSFATGSNEIGASGPNNFGGAAGGADGNVLFLDDSGSGNVVVDIGGQETVGLDSGSAPESQSAFKPVRLEFRGAKLKEVIRALAEESHVNFTLGDGVGDTPVNVNFKNVPWDHALRAVLETNGLGMSQLDGNIVRIDTLTRLAEEKIEKFKILQSSSKLLPTKILVMPLSYADAEGVKSLVDNMLTASKIDDRVRVDMNKITNALIVEAIPSDLSKVKSLVERLDVETPQVQISSRLIEVIRTNDNFLGIDWSGPFNLDAGRGLGFGNLVFPNSLLSDFSVDTGTAAQAGTGGLGSNMQIGSINNAVELDLRLRLSESRGITNILQNNTVIVKDTEEAKITAGQEDFIPVTQGENTQLMSVTYNLELSVVPKITADGNVALSVEITSDLPATARATGATASRTTRSLASKFIKRSGETAAIGGLYTTNKEERRTGVPYLSRIPILGALFRSYQLMESKRELIILVTPSIVSGGNSGGGSLGGGGMNGNISQNFGAFGANKPANFEGNSSSNNFDNNVNNGSNNFGNNNFNNTVNNTGNNFGNNNFTTNGNLNNMNNGEDFENEE